MPVIPIHVREKIVALHRDGKNSNQIQKVVGHTRSAILNIIRKIKSGFGVENKPRAGRPPKLTNRERRSLVIKSKKEPFSTARLLRTASGLESKVSIDTVKRVLRSNNLFGRVAVKKPKLNVIQKRKRFQYAVNHRSWTSEDWRKVIFTDETRIEVLPKSRTYVRRPKSKTFHPKYTVKSMKFSPSIMIWGGVRYDGKRMLIKCENSIDSDEYQRVLNNALPYLYNTRYLLQQDGARCHTSHSTTHFLTNKCVRMLQPWPPQSPDLNIIEGIWAILKENVKKRCPLSREDLWNVTKEEFDAIPNEIIQNLFNSLPRRIKAVASVRGATTKY